MPTGRCSISASPDESDVLFIYASDNNVYESDNAGGSWTNLGNPQPQGRIPFVVTNQRADSGSDDKFDMWAGDVQLFRADCTTPADTTNTTTRRCPASGSWINAQNGAHWDGGDLLFDSRGEQRRLPRPVLLRRRRAHQHHRRQPGLSRPDLDAVQRQLSRAVVVDHERGGPRG